MIAFPETEAADNTASNRDILLSGGPGDDYIEGLHKWANTIIQGGEGSDKIVAGNTFAFQKVYGED